MGHFNGFRQQILPLKDLLEICLPPRFVRVELEPLVKVCGAGLNIPGKAWGPQSPICTARRPAPGAGPRSVQWSVSPKSVRWGRVARIQTQI